MPIVEFKDVSRVYVSGDHEQKALDKVSFSLDEGKFVVILGPSGAAKTTPDMIIAFAFSLDAANPCSTNNISKRCFILIHPIYY